jgi:hypothetical protein
LVNACADLIGPGRPIARLGPGVFASARTLLVVRHAGRAGRLPRRARLLWLIDDDIAAACVDPGLPWTARVKLRVFEAAHGRRLRAQGAEVIASSDALAARFGPPLPRVIRPVWSEPLSDLAHHGSTGPVRIGYLGSGIHRADFAFLEPVLLDLLRARPEVELHLAANHTPGPALAAHPRVVRFAETAWSDYRRTLGARRLHLALYPLRDTPVNRARSDSKLTEHAIAGAGGVYSAAWPPAAQASAAQAGLVLPEDQAAWSDALHALTADRPRMAALAQGARRLAGGLNDAVEQRSVWCHLFDL